MLKSRVKTNLGHGPTNSTPYNEEMAGDIFQSFELITLSMLMLIQFPFFMNELDC